jgi:hypothetical protein
MVRMQIEAAGNGIFGFIRPLLDGDRVVIEHR